MENNMTSMGDGELIAHIQSNEGCKREAALGELYRRYHQDVWRFARRNAVDEPTADDIFGTVWAFAFENINGYEWTGIPVKSWLMSITYRKIKEETRQPITDAYDEVLERNLWYTLFESEAESDTPAHSKINGLLHSAMKELSDLQQRIIQLIYFERVENSTEIAEKLGVKPSTVRGNHRRALQYLAKNSYLSGLF